MGEEAKEREEKREREEDREIGLLSLSLLSLSLSLSLSPLAVRRPPSRCGHRYSLQQAIRCFSAGSRSSDQKSILVPGIKVQKVCMQWCSQSENARDNRKQFRTQGAIACTEIV